MRNRRTTLGLVAALSVAVFGARNAVAGEMYWGHETNARPILRANLDGSDVTEILSGTVLSEVNNIALDVTEGKMYWTDQAGILRANLDGTEATRLYGDADSYGRIGGFALDLTAHKMYWGHQTNARPLMRAALDGSDIEEILSGSVLSEVNNIALDVNDEKMYWTDQVGIIRADLDGTHATPVFGGVYGRIGGFALDVPVPEPAAVVLCTASGLMVLLERRKRN